MEIPGAVGRREVFEIMVEELDGYVATLENIWTNEMAAANSRLRVLELDPLDPWDDNTEIWAPQGL